MLLVRMNSNLPCWPTIVCTQVFLHWSHWCCTLPEDSESIIYVIKKKSILWLYLFVLIFLAFPFLSPSPLSLSLFFHSVSDSLSHSVSHLLLFFLQSLSVIFNFFYYQILQNFYISFFLFRRQRRHLGYRAMAEDLRMSLRQRDLPHSTW